MKELGKPVYSISGARGRSIEIYPNKCVITVSVTVGSIFSSNSTDGQKTIFFSDVIGVQFKKPGFTLGYIQLETASSSQNNEQSNFFNENTFTFETSQLSVYEAEKIRDYILGQVELIKTLSCFGISPSQEIKKYKKLFEEGIISQKDYSDMKTNLLGLMGPLAKYDDIEMSENMGISQQMNNITSPIQGQGSQNLASVQSPGINHENNMASTYNIPAFPDVSSQKPLYPQSSQPVVPNRTFNWNMNSDASDNRNE